MDKNEIKKANRKALPKFILLLLVSVMIGGISGYLSGGFRLDTLREAISNACSFFGENIAPWLIVGIAVIMPVVCFIIYRSAKKLLSAWDGDDEEIPGIADRKISVSIMVSAISLVVSFFLIAASYSGGFSTFDSKERTVAFSVGIISFIAVMIESVIIQQKCVDAAKRTNPEKKASVYDIRFQKKWLEDSDEAEKILAGKCAYKAYTATNTVCAVLAIAFAVCALVFNIGYLPSFAVCLIWIVNLSVYCKEALKY